MEVRGPSNFRVTERRWRQAIERFAVQPDTFQSGRHPTFGELTRWEWIRWGYLHADHHFRQFGL